MPEFILDYGSREGMETFKSLDSFTQGYIEALFFTAHGDDWESAAKRNGWKETANGWRDTHLATRWTAPSARSVCEHFGYEPDVDDSPDWSFSDLAPETLAAIIADCDKFKASIRKSWIAFRRNNPDFPRGETEFGRDFLYTRNGHGCGFWDGDWPEGQGEHWTRAARAFPSTDLYMGDDGKLYLG